MKSCLNHPERLSCLQTWSSEAKLRSMFKRKAYRERKRDREREGEIEREREKEIGRARARERLTKTATEQATAKHVGKRTVPYTQNPYT